MTPGQAMTLDQEVTDDWLRYQAVGGDVDEPGPKHYAYCALLELDLRSRIEAGDSKRLMKRLRSELNALEPYMLKESG